MADREPPAAPHGAARPRGWRRLLRREVLIALVIVALVLAAVLLYVMRASTDLRTFYHLP